MRPCIRDIQEPYAPANSTWVSGHLWWFNRS